MVQYLDSGLRRNDENHEINLLVSALQSHRPGQGLQLVTVAMGTVDHRPLGDVHRASLVAQTAVGGSP